MAKKKAASVNKSEAIRNYRKANPKQKPKQIAEALGKQGVEVSAGFVSTILSTSKKKKTAGKRGRPKGSVTVKRGRPAGAARKSSHEVSVDSLLRVKEIVSEMGSIDEARTALITLEQLMN